MLRMHSDKKHSLKCFANKIIFLLAVTLAFLFSNNCMRIAPPLIITEEEIKISCAIITKALEKVYL